MLRTKRGPQAKLAYCEQCGKLFSSVRGGKLCPECDAVDRAAKDKIKEYLRDNPKATLREAAEATGAPADSVKRLSLEVISSKLNSNRKSETAHPCANCGKMIKTGTYCSECASELQKKAQQSAAAMSAVATSRESEEKPTAVKGLDESFNEGLKERPARRRLYQGVLENRRSN